MRWLRAANGGQGSQPVAAPAGGWQCSSLRIAMLDATGHEVQSAIRPVRGLVPAMGDAYFDVHVPDSPEYRVSVASYDFVEFATGQ